ncbi:MAG TPA: hypothetical protein VGM28_02190 [Candidatus Limnocylindrales bacterium]|jgi:hypothetical protein
MTRRLAPIVAASLALIAAAACAATPSPATTPPAIVAGPVPTAAAPTPVPTPATPSPTLQPTAAPTTPPDEGNVDGDVYPQLTIEEPDASTLRVTLQDPEAKAWRLVVKGTGDLTFDRLEIEVETGDVAPVVTAREIHDSELVGTIDLSAFANGMGAAGGCHATLHVCIDSDGFRLPKNGNGRFRIRLSVAHAVGPLSITGSTAGWPSEPFVLGPWTGTAPFTWSRS